MKNVLWLSLIVLISNQAKGESYFDSLWTKIESQNYAMKAASESHKASTEELKKASRHWLPQAYIGGATYLTDDAGANMFGLLSQRSIQNTDFMPTSLNEPGMNHFTKATIGLELPLYEGNSGIGYRKVSEKMALAEELNHKATRTTVLSEYVKMFWAAKLYYFHEESFSKNLNSLKNLERNYQLGSRDNLLGYSGKLGIKNLGLKIQSLIEMTKVKKQTQLSALEELTHEKVELDKLSSVDMDLKYQSFFSGEIVGQKYATDAFGQKAQARQESVDLQKARLRPQIALFADQTFFKGDRDLADAKTIGISLRWNIFSKENMNIETKSVYEMYAAQNAHLAYQQNDKIEYNSLLEFEKVLNESYERAMESKRYLAEQSEVTTRLFKNGMINILQLLEVLNQEVTLNENILEIEEKRLEVRAKKLLFVRN